MARKAGTMRGRGGVKSQAVDGEGRQPAMKDVGVTGDTFCTTFHATFSNLPRISSQSPVIQRRLSSVGHDTSQNGYEDKMKSREIFSTEHSTQ
ncbi:hypothetical protein STEG23_029258 [Scotinomys teguina]